MIVKRLTCSFVTGVVAVLCIGMAHAAAIPAFSVAAGTAITPVAADTWYCAQSSGCNTSGTRQLWTTSYPVEITALANALRNDADLIYEYVRNNIEIIPIYGLQKGALGAMIDRSGTAFDQAQLMVELLRSSGKTANYIAGTITLTGSQIQSWLGVTDAASLSKILADGGIPATVTPASGTVTSVTLSHIWVQVNISGTNYYFDPSFKPHTFTAALDIGAASGWSDTAFLAAGQNTIVSGNQVAASDVPPNNNISIPYITNVNAAGLQTQLTNYANALTTYLKTHGSVAGQVYATQQLEDVIGRQDILANTATLRQTTLPNTPVTQHTWTGNIPDVYRAKLTVEMLQLNTQSVRLSQVLFGDEVYGRRMFYDTYLGGNSWNDDTIQLQVDGIYVGSQFVGSDAPGARTGYVRLSVDHPYAASSGAYLDVTGANAILKTVDFVSPVAVVIGFGDTSDRLQSKYGTEQIHDTILPTSTYFMCGTTCEPIDKVQQPAQESTLARAYAGWLSQYSRMAMIQSRMKSAIHVNHHTLGVSYRRSYMVVTNTVACPQCWSVGEGALVLDVDTAISINSKAGNANDRRTLSRSLAAAADTLEASQFEQLSGTATPSSVAHRFDWGTNNAATMRYYLVKQNANSVDLFPTGPTPYFYPSIYSPVSKYTNAGYKAIVAADEFMGPGRDCSTPPCTSSQSIFRFERGGAFQAFGGDGVTTAHIVTDQTASTAKGGSAGDPPNYDDNFKPDKSADLLKDQFKDRSRDFGVDLQSGDFTYSPGADISVGLGEFPYKLSVERTFKSGESHTPGMGLGWSHNLDIRMNLSTSGAAAMGQSSTLPAAITLMALYATQRIYATEPSTDDAFLRRWVLTPFVQSWWAGKIRFNTATYTAGSSSKVFERLSDGSFNPPGGYNPANGSSYWNLAQTGSPTGYGTKWGFANISFTLTSPSKDVQSFAYQGRLNRDLNQVYLYGPHHYWHITNWTFPQGVSLTFNYAPVDLVNFVDDHLVSVQNSLGRQINFTTTANSSWDNCNIQSINDNAGHTVTFDCANNKVTSPSGDIDKVTFGSINCWGNHATRPMCSPFLTEVYAPSSTALPKVRLTYDAVGRVKTYSDAVTVATPASRNPYNFFITGGTRGERQDPAGFYYTVYYDQWGREVNFTDELARTSFAAYDGLNRVTRRTSAELIISDYSYEPRGNVTQIKQTPKTTSYAVPANLTVSATYDTACGNVKTVTDANSNVTTWAYNPTTCLVSQVQQPSVINGITGSSAVPTTTYTYKPIGLIDTLTDPSGVAAKFTYDASGNRTLAQVDSTGLNLSKSYGYDTVGNIISVTDGLSNTTGFLYDADRRINRVVSPAATCGVTENIWTGGLVTKVRRAKVCSPNFVTDADWQVWLKAYGPNDKIDIETDPDGGTTNTDYDPVDRVEYLTQSIGGGQAVRVIRTQYDAAGQVYRLYKAFGSADQITYAEYAYTLDGRQASYKDAKSNLTTLDYDGYGRLAKTIFPDATYEQYGYDNNANLLTKRNRSAQIITMVFDALNRETSRVVPDNPNYAGNFARTLASNYDLASRQWDLTADGQTLMHRYDSAGRLTNVNDTLLNALSAGDGNVGFTYDAASNKKTVGFVATGATGYTMTNNYDTGERLSAILGGGTAIASFGYDPLSRISSTSFMDGSSGAYTYEADDDLQSLTNSYSGGSVVLTYTHNGAHQIVGSTINDAQYLMKQVGSNQAYTPNTLNQYSAVNGASLSYDPNGNLLGDGTSVYSYDEENRLRQVVTGGVTSVYQYDPLGRRRSKTVGSTVTYFVSDGPNEMAELGNTGSRLRLYINGGGMDSRVAIYDSAGGTGWSLYHPNHQGSTLFTTRSNAVADKYHYGPFGEPLSTDVPTGNAIRYTGRYLDAESGLYYYRARYFSPKLGRFLQTDPIGIKDDLNLYTYVGNDPMDKTDPSGETCTQNDGKYACQVDSIKNRDRSVTQRADFSKSQLKQVAAFEKSYTKAVNELAANPDRKASISVPGGRGKETVSAGFIAKTLANRQVNAIPYEKGGANTISNGVNAITNVRSLGLSGAARFRGVQTANADEGRQLVITHEGIHGTNADESRGNLPSSVFNSVHQGPFNQAAQKLLGNEDSAE